MEMTFRHFMNAGTSFGCYGKKALDILKCMLTSGMIDNENVSNHQLIRAAGMKKYALFDKTLAQGRPLYPVVKCDGQIGVAEIGYINEKFDHESDYAVSIIVKNIGKFIESMKTLSEDENTPFYFYTEDGEISTTIKEFKCFRYIIEKKNAARAKSLYGEELVDAIVGKPLNVLKAETNKVLRKSVQESLIAAYAEHDADWRKAMHSAYPSSKAKAYALKEVVKSATDRIKTIVSESRKSFQESTDEDEEYMVNDLTRVFAPDEMIEIYAKRY